MIAATDISIDGDTAWWIADFNRAAYLDRPCDWCFDGFYPIRDRNDDEIECPDCDGTGRHCFDIEVDGCTCYTYHEDWGCPGSRTLRVSVVEVLPVQATDDGGRLIHWDVDSEEFWLFESAGDDLADLVVLPESAAPGKWAVRLRVLRVKM